VDSFAPETIALAVAIAAVAGVIRGVTGFGGAMVMSPPFALILGPLVMVPVVLLLESVAALPMVLQTRRLARWGVIAPIALAACIAAPLGTYVLVHADPQILRRVIAATVILFAVLLLRGWRYAGRQRAATGASLGALAGAMASATSIGGPPVILYLLAGPDPIEVTRANLMFFVAAVSLAGVAMLALAGGLDPRAPWIAAGLMLPYYGGTLAGSKLFSRFDDRRFRQLTLILMMAVAAGILVA
jgi:uncharacterized membrane protein YfcA